MELEEAEHFRPGDLIRTCKGYNERIVSINLEEDDVLTERGHCSIIHCCSPATMKEAIENYFLICWGTPEGLKAAKGYGLEETIEIVRRLKDGEEVFTEDGRFIPFS